MTPLAQKSTVEEIRSRFDADVERFSQLQTGQSATIDAPLVMELITRAAIGVSSPLQRVLDVGCGAGNNSLKLRLLYGSDFEIDLLDLSEPMVKRAAERLSAVNQETIRSWIGDVREAELPAGEYDVIIAAAVLHHLRNNADWEHVFRKLYRAVKPGGSLWISDLVSHDLKPVQHLMWEHYGAYLTELGGEQYREQVFRYIDLEDSPRSLLYQLRLMELAGFSDLEVLHKHSCFAAFGGVKPLG